MLRLFMIAVLLVVNTFALSVSSDDIYKVYKSDKYEIVYTEDYANEAKFIKLNIDDFLKENDKSFGFSFDEPLKIVLISNNIQVPNAFSIQVPFNMGIYYNAGSSMNDYFATKSWLITLFTHEMIHNYQINAKKSEISKTLHKYLGNNYMPVWAGFVPFFTLPNELLPTAFLEGNAVLNESIYNNGGRLYNDSLNAMKNALVFADEITPTRFINDHLDFPYTTEKYIVGGYYMRYLANTYGLDKVNSFFYNNSIHSIIPILLNRSFIETFGINFEQSIYDFVNYTKEKYKDFKTFDNSKVLAKSKSEITFSKDEGKIYFITTNLVNKKELNSYDIQTNNLDKKDTKLQNGKIFQIDNKLYTNTYAFISSTLYKNGLFDENLHILKNTVGKSVQDIYKDKIAYIDINSSFSTTKLYIDNSFYDEVSSSALFDDNGNIYYFKQNGNKRQLYKNKQFIFSFEGYFSHLVDIKDGIVYFIANTQNGSSLYKYENQQIFKLIDADNITDAKLIDTNSALVQTVTKDGYEVSKAAFAKDELSTIKIDKLNLPNKQFQFDSDVNNVKLDSKNYNEFQNLEFSLLYPAYSYSSTDGSTYILNGLFIDPIMYNMLDLYAYKTIDKTTAGVTYINERKIPYSINIYNVDEKVKTANQRETAGSISIYGPLYKEGRNTLTVNLKKYYDEDYKDKAPVVFSLTHAYDENFMLEDSEYFGTNSKVLAKNDREDKTYGVDLQLNKHLANQFYINAGFKYVDSSTQTLTNARGVKVVDNELDTLQDETNVLMEGFDYNFYVKDIQKASIGLSKTFYFHKYFSKFPVSLRKESIFYQYNHFDLTTVSNHTINENIVGIKFDVLFFHQTPIPITIKYIDNDTSTNGEKVTISLGMEF